MAMPLKTLAETVNFWHPFASRGCVSDSWAFLLFTYYFSNRRQDTDSLQLMF